MMDDTTAAITQLQNQQSLFTQALKAAVEGRWTGADSVEAYLYALYPPFQDNTIPDPPVTTSEYDDESGKG